MRPYTRRVDEFRFSPRPNRAAEIGWRAWGSEAFGEARAAQRPVLLAISALVMIFRSAGAGWGLDGVDNNFLRPPAVFDWIPEHLNPIASWHLLPFWALIAIAVAGGAITAWRSGFKDRLVIACWAAIIPIALNNFLFAATGWAQFGYRYGLDFYPFLFLLVVKVVGNQLRWYHMALIVVSIVINLWGVLWIYQFDPAHLNDWTWVSF